MVAALALSVAAAAPAAARTVMEDDYAHATFTGGQVFSLALSGLVDSTDKSGDLKFSGYIDCGDGTSRWWSIGTVPVDTGNTSGNTVSFTPPAATATADVTGWYANPCDYGASDWFELKVNMNATIPNASGTTGTTVDNQASGGGTVCWNTGTWPDVYPDVCTTLTSVSGELTTHLQYYG